MHLSTENALDLMEGRLEQALTMEWTGHLGSCSHCSTVFEDWQLLRTALRRPHLESAPRRMLESVAALFQPPKRMARRASLRSVIATLVYDSFAQPAFA